MQFSFSEKRNLIYNCEVVGGGFALKERFLVGRTSFELAEFTRITTGVLGLAREIRQELEIFYNNLSTQLKDQQDIVQNFKNVLGFEADEHKLQEREFIEGIILGPGEKERPVITFQGLLEEFELQFMHGEVFDHEFLEKFGKLLAHKLRNSLTAGRIAPRHMRKAINQTIVAFEKAVAPHLLKIGRFAKERDVVEPTEPTRLPYQQIVNLLEYITSHTDQDYCISNDQVRDIFQGVGLSDGEVSLLRTAIFYLARSVNSYDPKIGQTVVKQAISNLKEIIRSLSNSKAVPHKLLALQILQHLDKSQDKNGTPDFVLKPLSEIERMSQDPNSLESDADPDYVLEEMRLRVAAGGGRLSFLK